MVFFKIIFIFQYKYFLSSEMSCLQKWMYCYTQFSYYGNSKVLYFLRSVIFSVSPLEIWHFKCSFDVLHLSPGGGKNRQCSGDWNFHLHFNGLFSSGSAYVSLKRYKIGQLLFKCDHLKKCSNNSDLLLYDFL